MTCAPASLGRYGWDWFLQPQGVQLLAALAGAIYLTASFARENRNALAHYGFVWILKLQDVQ